jgi:tetratricopeptide (TPR) repeat protein
MSESDLLSFENRLNNDFSFREQLKAYRSFEGALKDAKTVEVYDRVGAWEEEIKKKKHRNVIRKIWISSTSIAAAAAIAFFIWVPLSDSDEDVAISNFRPYDNVVTVRGEENDLDRAMQAYEEGRYDRVLTLLDSCEDDPIATFYRAESYMALKRYDRAITEYEEVIESEGVFQEIAQFHYALALLASENRSKAIEALKNISEKSIYADDAREILKNL